MDTRWLMAFTSLFLLLALAPALYAAPPAAAGLPPLPLIIVSGFLDGIHPCGIAVLLFFVAFLLSLRRSRPQMLAVGGAYIFGVFAAYLLIGLGILGVFSIFPGHFMAKLGATLLILIGLVSLHDGIRNTTTLRMPKIAGSSAQRLLEQATLPAALGAGVLVGLCAFPCAGGLYVAIIGLLAAQMAGPMGMLYLLLYNLMFVLPLILILLLASNATILKQIEELERGSRRSLRIALGLLMLLAGLLIWATAM